MTEHEEVIAWRRRAIFGGIDFFVGSVHSDAQHFHKDATASPSCLMTRSDTAPIVSMKVLVEENQVLPMPILLEFLRGSMDRPNSAGIPKKGRREAARDLLSHFPQREEVS